MIKLTKSTFCHEALTKRQLVKFISSAKVLSMRSECLRFEKVFAQKQKRRFAVLTSSGSAANLILIQAMLNLGLFKKGDKIGISALTWATNVMPILELGLVPVVLDINIQTLNVNSSEIEKHAKILKGLFITNVLGLSDDIGKIKQICQRNKIILLEDNCESLGSMIGGVLLGNFGLASTFSFFVGHHLSTIEGGMVCTDDRKLYEMLLMVRAHGWDRDLPERAQKELRDKTKTDYFYAKYTFYNLSYNARPTEITGFLGNTQIKYLREIILKRKKNFMTFARVINANKDFVPLKWSHMDTVSNMAMPVVCVSSNKVLFYKKKFAPLVEIRPIITGNIARQPFFKKYIKKIPHCPNAEFVHRHGFYFPNNPELTKAEISTIVNLLGKN